MLWFAESTGVAQAEDPAASIGAEDSAVQTSAGEPSIVEFAAASVAVEAWLRFYLQTKYRISELLKQ